MGKGALEGEIRRFEERIEELEREAAEGRRTREALIESEARFRILIENAPEAIVVLDPKTRRFVDVNENAVRLFQLTREQLLCNGPVEISPPLQPDGSPSAEKAWAKVEAVMAGQFQVFDWVHLDSTGREIPCEVRLALMPFAGKNLIRGSVTDISRQKEAARALRKSQELYRKLVDNANDIIYTHDLEGNFTSVNRAITKHMGYSIEEALRLNMAQIIAPEFLERTVSRTRQKLAGEGATTYEPRVITKSGRHLAVEVSSTLLLEEGKPVGVQGIVRNLTERKKAEREIARLHKFHSGILDSLPAEVAVLDLEGNYLYVNPAQVPDPKLRNRAIGGSSVELCRRLGFPEKVGRRRLRAIQECIREKELLTVEEEVPGSNGETRHFVRFYSPVVHDGETVSHVIGYGLDITERRRAELERQRLEEQIQHAQKLESLGVLAGGIAHDFNNLLMGVLGNAGLALKEVPPLGPVRRALEDIEKAAQRAADLTGQLLAYSGRGRFVVEPFDLNHLVSDMVHLLEVSISKKSRLICAFSDPLPAIEGDAAQMQQVVMNLITNASDALEPRSGTIEIKTGCLECTQEYLKNTYLDDDLEAGSYVFLEVVDSGAGMDEKNLARIFDPFFTTKFAGRGLGLAAVLGIVRAHRGAIEVRSRRGRGTSFRYSSRLLIFSPQSCLERKPTTPSGGAAARYWSSTTRRRFA